MRTTTLLIFVILSLCLLGASLVESKTFQSRSKNANADDGTKCAVCVLALTEVYRQLPNVSGGIRDLLKKVCDLLPNNKVQGVCKFIVNDFSEDILKFLLSRETPDYICSKLSLCKQCHLIHGANYYEDKLTRMNAADSHENTQLLARVLASVLFTQLKRPPEPSHIGGYPKIDLDGDHFSPIHMIPRGADWRGADCNDYNKNIKPGVLESASGQVDRDCNGIPADAEQKYCSGEYAPRQLVNLGDSATAGFMIPVEWIDLKNLTHIVDGLLDELDRPDRAWGSGWNPNENVDSLYNRLRNNNRCYHRQFQNVGKNGGDSFDLVAQIDTVSLDNSKPVLATVAYIGNDICTSTLAEMTTPEEMEENMIAGLRKLDSVLPANSKVLLFGLVDGSIIYDFVGKEFHPIGGNITYGEFYSFLTCTGLNPCNTWLTTDAATRAAASARAMELNEVVSRVAKTNEFKNFDLAFIDFGELLDEAFDIARQEGKPLSSLIDPVDGFHPYIKVGHPILSRVLWTHLTNAYPDFIGPVNPNNDAIEKEFGNQGGY